MSEELPEPDATASRNKDSLPHFVVVVPVADRPLHLESCLESLLALCCRYGCGGKAAGGRYRKVSVLVADDSKDEENLAAHRRLAESYSAQGLDCFYFGPDEQLAILEELHSEQQEKLAVIVGSHGPHAFHHKGPSITRNIAYLKLAGMAADNEDFLFWFIDSDQEFRLRAEGEDGHSLDYFGELARIFGQTDTMVLTGKVVGDPPVSPAVMAGNFLDDVLDFLARISEAAPDAPCAFHGDPERAADDASYHDMAGLFGFNSSSQPFQFHCRLPGAHDHAACLAGFAAQLGRFFYGEHPTRKTAYQPEEALASLRPARTVYTGNYILRPQALKWFIPFASLRLRMAGPTLGRLIRAEIGPRFASANLPLLHKRTLEDLGRSEFRPGIEAQAEEIDLSGEFERQFWGDVMLFSIEKLCELGYPALTPDPKELVEILQATRTELARRYGERRLAIGTKRATLEAAIANPATWWNQSPRHSETVATLEAFAANIARNFGPAAEAIVEDSPSNQDWIGRLAAAIAAYAGDRHAWQAALEHRTSLQEPSP